jgi:hypothetical protein
MVFARFCRTRIGAPRLAFGSAAKTYPILSFAKPQWQPLRWVDPTSIATYHVFTNPVYAGAYVYGKSRHEITFDARGARREACPQSRENSGPYSFRTITKATLIGTSQSHADRVLILARAHINQAVAA